MGVFERVVVGVDGTGFGFEALRQALTLLAPEGSLVAVTALDEAAASGAGFLAGHAAANLDEEADAAHRRAAELIADRSRCSARLVQGDARAAILGAARDEEATLVALGGRHRSRIAGLVLSGVSTVVLHDAPCSVLLSHPNWGEAWRPRRLIAGVDGSPESLAALATADELVERFGSSRMALCATHGEPLASDEPWSKHVDRWISGDPVVALVDDSIFADLIVVGSRGRHGLRSLGSVSERVAHQAHCSTLVVRHRAGVESALQTP